MVKAVVGPPPLPPPPLTRKSETLGRRLLTTNGRLISGSGSVIGAVGGAKASGARGGGAAARIGERSNRTELTASQFVEAIMLVDETKEAASIADALSWGFGVAPGEEVARDERISPEEFFANLSRRGGAQRRSQPVRKLRSNIRIVSGFAAPADTRR